MSIQFQMAKPQIMSDEEFQITAETTLCRATKNEDQEHPNVLWTITADEAFNAFMFGAQIGIALARWDEHARDQMEVALLLTQTRLSYHAKNNDHGTE